jgi:hypothetical protein
MRLTERSSVYKGALAGRNINTINENTPKSQERHKRAIYLHKTDISSHSVFVKMVEM